MNDERLLIYTGPSPRGWHRLQLFLECPQRFAWKYRSEKAPERPESPPLIKGSLIHLGLAQHYAQVREMQEGRDPKRYYDPSEAISILADAKPEWAPYADLAKEVVTAHQLRWQHERFRVIGVEELLDGVVEGHRFTGRMDLIVEDSAGKVWVIDHKTTGRLQSKQREFYSVSGQILGYQTLGRMRYGERFGGMRLNMIQHGGSFQFERWDVRPAPHLLARWPSAVADAERRIAALDAEKRPVNQWPVAPSELVCYHRYGACDFIEACRWGEKKT